MVRGLKGGSHLRTKKCNWSWWSNMKWLRKSGSFNSQGFSNQRIFEAIFLTPSYPSGRGWGIGTQLRSVIENLWRWSWHQSCSSISLSLIVVWSWVWELLSHEKQVCYLKQFYKYRMGKSNHCIGHWRSWLLQSLLSFMALGLFFHGVLFTCKMNIFLGDVEKMSRGTRLVCSGCHHKRPQTGSLKE